MSNQLLQVLLHLDRLMLSRHRHHLLPLLLLLQTTTQNLLLLSVLRAPAVDLLLLLHYRLTRPACVAQQQGSTFKRAVHSRGQYIACVALLALNLTHGCTGLAEVCSN